MGARGPKGKYSADVHEAIIKNLEAGCFKIHACNAVGVSLDAMDDWITKGDAGVQPYVKFAFDVHVAQGRDAVRNQAIISKAAQGVHLGDWKAAAWNLEKKYPKLYGRMAELRALQELERPVSPWKPPPGAVVQPVAGRKLDS